MPTCQVTAKNFSDYSMDLVWENAQDMEHVGTLHSNTNIAFEIISVEKSDDKKFLYRQLAYSATRKVFGFIPMKTFGYRKIIKKYYLVQVEFNPLLNIRSELLSTILPHPNDEQKCIMVDHVSINIPWWLLPLKNVMSRAILRHAKTQCEEDEDFRARRKVLLDKKINIPPSLFNESFIQKFEKKVTAKYDVR
ncbi:hypothetical protein N9I82_00670 [Alphaproteobacteria bacterium]|nr:hypothetical protein [Alphaproteobacteria bacterium]